MGLLSEYQSAIVALSDTTSPFKKNQIRATPAYNNVVVVFGFIKTETDQEIEIYLGGERSIEEVEVNLTTIRTDKNVYKSYLSNQSASIKIKLDTLQNEDPERHLILARVKISAIQPTQHNIPVDEMFVRDYFPHGSEVFYLNNAIGEGVDFVKLGNIPLGHISLNQLSQIIKNNTAFGVASGGTQPRKCA